MKVKIIFLVISVAIFTAFGFGAKYLITNGKPVISFKPIALTTSISERLSGGASGTFVAGINYSLEDLYYFDNNSWIVANVVPIGNTNFDAGRVVIKHTGNDYKIVAGPNNEFTPSSITSFPHDVSSYLYSTGLVAL